MRKFLNNATLLFLLIALPSAFAACENGGRAAGSGGDGSTEATERTAAVESGETGESDETDTSGESGAGPSSPDAPDTSALPTDEPGASTVPSSDAPGASAAPSSDAPETSPSLSDVPDAPRVRGEVVVSFDYARQSGHASNQFAVWIEDENGKFIKTLYATRFTAAGGYEIRPDSIPARVESAGLSSLSDARADAVSGATPQPGRLEYVWDLTDENGGAPESARYLFFVEGSLRWKNRVLYTGEIDLKVGGVIEPQAEFYYAASDGQPALTDASPERGMISAVKAEVNLEDRG
jgi:hypothetical protein